MAIANGWTERDRHFMQQALIEARRSHLEQEVPIGCVVVRAGEIIARGGNLTNAARNGTRHAEFVAIDAILAAHNGDAAAARFHECELYVTCEPCIMCAGALALLSFRRVVFGCPNDKFGGTGSILTVHQDGCGGCGGPSSIHLASRQKQQGAVTSAQQVGKCATDMTQGGEHLCSTKPESAVGGRSGVSGADISTDTARSACSSSCGSAAAAGGFECVGGLFADEAVDLLREFYIMGNPLAPKPHRTVRPRHAAS